MPDGRKQALRVRKKELREAVRVGKAGDQKHRTIGVVEGAEGIKQHLQHQK
jgi:hypothetical protein